MLVLTLAAPPTKARSTKMPVPAPPLEQPVSTDTRPTGLRRIRVTMSPVLSGSLVCPFRLPRAPAAPGASSWRPSAEHQWSAAAMYSRSRVFGKAGLCSGASGPVAQRRLATRTAGPESSLVLSPTLGPPNGFVQGCDSDAPRRMSCRAAVGNCSPGVHASTYGEDQVRRRIDVVPVHQMLEAAIAGLHTAPRFALSRVYPAEHGPYHEPVAGLALSRVPAAFSFPCSSTPNP